MPESDLQTIPEKFDEEYGHPNRWGWNLLSNGRWEPLPFLTGELRWRRQEMQLSQVVLAEQLGVTETTLARWERGVEPVGNVRMVRLALERLESLG